MTRDTGGRSVNGDKNCQKVSGCRIAGVITKIITLNLALRAKFGIRKRIPMDNKSAFRHVGVSPDQTVAFIILSG